MRKTSVGRKKVDRHEKSRGCSHVYICTWKLKILCIALWREALCDDLRRVNIETRFKPEYMYSRKPTPIVADISRRFNAESRVILDGCPYLKVVLSKGNNPLVHAELRDHWQKSTRKFYREQLRYQRHYWNLFISTICLLYLAKWYRI